MKWLVVVSIALRVGALLLALLMLRRSRDLRIAFVALTLAAAAVHQALALSMHRGPIHLGHELTSLVISAMALLSVWLLRGLLSDKQRSERALEEREAHFRSLVENSLDVIVLLDAAGRVLYANPATRKVLKYEPAELIGQDGFAFIDADDRDGARALFAQAQANPGTGYGMLCRILRKDASLATVQAAGSVVCAANGERHALLEMRDVTAESEAALENQRLQGELYQSQKMETLGSLTGGIAHDFNNLLTPILGNVELARSQLPIESDVQPVLSRVIRAAEQARDLVKRMLVFGRRTEDHRQPVVLAALLRETFELVRSSLPQSVRSQCELAFERGVVLADPVELQQVLINLCTNAAHAMRAGGGLLQLELLHRPAEAAPARHIAASPHAELALLRVRDSGEGMTPEIKARIFEPFFSTKPPGEGTGLGLSVVHGIVTRLGGFIEIDSAPGRGTCFDIYLPLLSQARLPEAVEPLEPEQMCGKVMLVEDQAVVAEVGAELLRLRGLEVEIARCGELALERVGVAPASYFAVVTDYAMPGMTGLELARALRRLRADLPIVLTTGFAADDVHDAGKALAGLTVLPKPYTSDGLCRAIRQADRAMRARADAAE
jgi:PAS domain S-box-containing protein